MKRLCSTVKIINQIIFLLPSAVILNCFTLFALWKVRFFFSFQIDAVCSQHRQHSIQLLLLFKNLEKFIETKNKFEKSRKKPTPKAQMLCASYDRSIGQLNPYVCTVYMLIILQIYVCVVSDTRATIQPIYIILIK